MPQARIGTRAPGPAYRFGGYVMIYGQLAAVQNSSNERVQTGEKLSSRGELLSSKHGRRVYLMQF